MTKFKFNLKRLASLMIIFVIAFAMLPTGALAAEENGNCTGTHTDCTALDSTTLASLIVTDAKGNESYTLSAGSYYLTEDITTAMTITVSENQEVTLCLNGHALTYSNSETKASVITVKGGATLNLCDCNGSNGSHTITSPVTNESVTIAGGLITGGTGNKNPGTVETVTYGGGIYVEGTLNMYGGNISGNIPRGSETLEGGGVYTPAKLEGKIGTFNLYGGSVSHNKAEGGGGGVRIDGTMNMYGGSISDNIAYNGGGIVNYGTLNISGGAVKNNKTNNTVQQLGSGGGVLNFGYMTLSGTGEISGNSAGGNDYASGGGVYNKDSSRNSGICRFTMTGGKITGNQANGSGGGVVTEFTGQSPTLFVMTGGSISGNRARVSGGVDNSGEMQLSGGSITGNIATEEGGGLRNTRALTVSGNPVITGNTNGNLYVRWRGSPLNKFCVATIGADGLTDGADIGVTTGKAPTENSPIAITTGTNAKDYSRYFTSDDDAYIIYNDSDKGNTLMLGVKHLVTNDAKDAEITYDGSTYDVSTMFTRDANAGTASYSIIGGTGAGKLNGSTLTITKGGTIMIKMTTAQNKTYVADEVTATLTVHNGPEPGNEGTEGGTSSNPKPTVSNVPVTGDNSNVLLWIALMVSAGTGLLGITICSKKRKAER